MNNSAPAGVTDQSYALARALTEALPQHTYGLTLSHNEHRGYRYTVEECVDPPVATEDGLLYTVQMHPADAS